MNWSQPCILRIFYAYSRRGFQKIEIIDEKGIRIEKFPQEYK